MSFDPFASSEPASQDPPTAEPFADKPVIAHGDPIPTNNTTKDKMTEWKTALKGDGGYDQAWTTVTTVGSAAEHAVALADFKSAKVAETLADVVSYMAGVTGKGNEKWEPRSNTPASRGHAAPAAPAGQAPTFTPQPQQAGGYQRRQAAPNLSEAPYAPPQCAHGTMKWNHKVSKAGNEYKGFFCAAPFNTPREQQCPKVEV